MTKHTSTEKSNYHIGAPSAAPIISKFAAIALTVPGILFFCTLHSALSRMKLPCRVLPHLLPPNGSHRI